MRRHRAAVLELSCLPSSLILYWRATLDGLPASLSAQRRACTRASAVGVAGAAMEGSHRLVITI